MFPPYITTNGTYERKQIFSDILPLKALKFDIIQISPPLGSPLPLTEVETTDQVFADKQHLDLGPRLKPLQV